MNEPQDRPSRTGVRTAGDRYQWLAVWSACVLAVNELVGNDVDAVGVEVDGAGALDDLVIYRLNARHTYTQVKYTVDATSPVNVEYLTALSPAGGPSMTQKFAAQHLELLNRGNLGADLVLMTNRAADPGDHLLRGRDSRTQLLLPAAGEGGPQSHRGKARTAWCKATGLTSEQLLDLLSCWRFDLARDVTHLEELVGLRMQAAGLRSGEQDVNAGIDWVARQVIAGRTLLAVAEIRAAVDLLELRAGQSRSVVSIATLKPDPIAGDAVVALDWVDRFEGEAATAKRRPLPPATWEQLQADIDAIPAALPSPASVLVTGSMRLPTAFTVGATLRMATNVDLAVSQRSELWRSDTQYDQAITPEIEETPIDQGDDVAIAIGLTTNIRSDVVAFLHRSHAPVNRLLYVSPGQGTNDRLIVGSAAANALAYGIREVVRPHARRHRHVHLFLAVPMGMAMLLGHRWNAMPSTTVYEDLIQHGYEAAFTLN